MSISRRRFLQYGLAAGATAALPGAAVPGAALRGAGLTQVLRGPSATGRRLEKFVQRLPLPGAGLVVASPSGTDRYSFTQVSIERQLHPQLPPTPLWAYDDGSGLDGQAGSFGMVVVAHSGTPLDVSYTHGIAGGYPSWIPLDTRLTGGVSELRVLTHLHGGFVGADSDGNPAQDPGGFGHGDTQTVRYPNQAPHNPATLLWFHDHAPGATRLNVFAGLAGAYLIRDEFDTGLEPNPVGIPGGAYEIPLVIQDRQFNADGTLRYPVSDIPGVTWIGEYFGDVMLVNGVVWPYLEVEPRMYRLRILNGCNSRILDLDVGGARFWQIGADGGMWDRPVRQSQLVMAPAERADVLIDFSGFAGQTLLVRNSKPASPVVTPAPPLTAVFQIRVGTAVSQPGPAAVPPTLPGRAAILAEPTNTRYITLNEVAPQTASWFLNLDAARFGDDVLKPTAGTVEDWVYVNLTEDTHPMHTHLFTHQVIGRTPFDADAYRAAHGGPDGVPGGIDPTPFATGPMIPAGPDERGFKDTVKVNPEYFTTIRGRFDLPAGVTGEQTYVHHCHIVEHEDNEMMQAFVVIP